MKSVFVMGIAMLCCTATMAQTNKKYQPKKDSMYMRKDSMHAYKMQKDSLMLKDSMMMKKKPMRKMPKPAKDSMM